MDKVSEEVTMTIALRKLALLEKNLEKREEQARIAGYVTSPVDSDFKEQVSKLMEKVRRI